MNEIMNLGIENKDGILVVSSRIVADGLGKQHKHVLESIGNIIENNTVELSTLFIESNYVGANGKLNREILLTKKGFTLYMFNIQGYNDFKLKYIDEFERMEKYIKEQYQVPKSFSEALLLAGKLQAEKERLELENKEMKPVVEYANNVLASNTLLTTTQIAKDFGLSAIKLNQLLHEQKVQYKQSGQWLLYSKYLDMGLAQSSTVLDKNGEARVFNKWTQKGKEFIYHLLRNKYHILPVVELGDDA